MNALITIGIICAVGLVAYFISENGRQIIRDIKSIIKWNLDRFKD